MSLVEIGERRKMILLSLASRRGDASVPLTVPVLLLISDTESAVLIANKRQTAICVRN